MFPGDSSSHLSKSTLALSVLVVDDNKFMRQILRTVLRQIGFREVVEASDGGAAMALVRKSAPGLVLLDWYMPDIPGSEVLSLLRSPAIDADKTIPVIVITGEPNRAMVRQAAALGASGILCKPISPKSLYAKLVSVLCLPQGAHGPEHQACASATMPPAMAKSARAEPGAMPAGDDPDLVFL